MHPSTAIELGYLARMLNKPCEPPLKSKRDNENWTLGWNKANAYKERINKGTK